MKLKHFIIAGAASFSLASLAIAQQQPGQEGAAQSPGVMDQERAGEQPGAIDQGAEQRGALEQGAEQPGAMEQEQPGAMEQESAPGATDQERAQQPGAMDQERGAMQRGGMMDRERAGRGDAEQDQQIVRQVQQKLKREGFQVGPVDGIYGPQTRSAVREFQQTEGLEPTGRLTAQTLAALEIQGGAAAAGEAGEPGAGTAAGAAEQDQQQQQQGPLESPGQPQQSPQQ